MKLFGKYRYIESGSIKGKLYLIRKRIPKRSRRTIIWGPTGFGKSSVFIADAIRRNKNILYISTLSFDGEWKEMRTEANVSVYTDYTDVKADFVGKVVYDFGQIPRSLQKFVFDNEVLPYLESNGITGRKDVTIILDNFVFLTREEGFLDKITKNWKCKVVLDLTCGVFPYSNELPQYFASKKWKSVPVFTRLFGYKEV